MARGLAEDRDGGSTSVRAACGVVDNFWRGSWPAGAETRRQMSLPMTRSDVILTLALVTERRKAVELTLHEITFSRRLGGTIGSRLCARRELPSAELPRQIEIWRHGNNGFILRPIRNACLQKLADIFFESDWIVAIYMANIWSGYVNCGIYESFHILFFFLKNRKSKQ